MAGLFCVVICGLLPLNYFGMKLLSGCRAYVGGESLWSKGQKEAVLDLSRYARSHRESDYQEYLASLNIPLGDHEARLALERPNPDIAAAKRGFLQGGNHLSDVPDLIFLFRRFRHVSYIDRAIAIWSKGEEYIAQLQVAGPRLHAEVVSSRPSAQKIEDLLHEIRTIDANVTPLENKFSETLGEGSRWLTRIFIVSMILTTGAFLAAALFITFLISRHLCEEVEQLRQGATQISQGEYDLALNLQSKDEIGDLARSFKIMADERQKVEKLKDEFYSSVVAANKELEAFSYSVSHDLRAPLRAIDGFSKELLINQQSRLDERGKADLNRIRAATQRMGDLIDDLLELSRLSRSVLKYERVDLSAQVREIAQKLKEEEPARKVHFNVESDLTAEGDSRLIRIALENLLQNSWKFTHLKDTTSIEFGLDRHNGNRTFYIRDNGVGFDMAYADKLFKPFQRLHDAKDYPGTGIGLALVQRIMQRHGGKVWGEAEENKGATFYFTLT